jgi:hypothetical protein
MEGKGETTLSEFCRSLKTKMDEIELGFYCGNYVFFLEFSHRVRGETRIPQMGFAEDGGLRLQRDCTMFG